ncbi:hypothetical protein IAE37_000464 [Pseudomonas sp. S31]|uniref:hypothetical protein n=1 Tax=Pseudomonas sp. S31 TaxID=1564473 RepID=UPI001914AFBD|nr:hypothetical protein [Pseudomonas sp. S31]MBK4998188.1 hypothetical protein [Pseudomonas sp. S31]
MNSDAVIRLITELWRPAMYCFVLVDPLAVPDDDNHSMLTRLHELLGDHAITRVRRADLPPEPALHPALICLSNPGAPLNMPLLEITVGAAGRDIQRRKRQICGWLLSEALPSQIADHLAALCQLPTPSGGTVFCPVYEPLRLELLGASLERPELGPWWPIEHWVFPSSGGKLASLKGQPHCHSALPAASLRVQEDVTLIETLLAARRSLLARSWFMDQLPLPAFAAVRASNHIEDARRLGLTAEEDILVLALHQLCLNADVHTLRPVQHCIETAIRLKRPLASLLAQYNEAAWERMTSVLPSARYRP